MKISPLESYFSFLFPYFGKDIIYFKIRISFILQTGEKIYRLLYKFIQGRKFKFYLLPNSCIQYLSNGEEILMHSFLKKIAFPISWRKLEIFPPEVILIAKFGEGNKIFCYFLPLFGRNNLIIPKNYEISSPSSNTCFQVWERKYIFFPYLGDTIQFFLKILKYHNFLPLFM